jgi:hypothetical protein
MDASDPPEPPPADTHDSSDPRADVPDQPEPPKKTGGAVKKRKRSLSYKTKKGSNNQKTSRAANSGDVDSSIPAEAPPPQEDTAVLAPDSTAFKKTSKADILLLLVQCQSELAQARSDILSKDKTIQRLSQKNEQLIESTQAARGAAREAKTLVKTVERSAIASAKKLEGEVLSAEQFAQQQSALLKEKEEEWNSIVMESVAKAREEEKVRLHSLFLLVDNRTISQSLHKSLSSQQRKERAIAVEKKNAAKQTKKLELEFNTILNQKNKQIKVSLYSHHSSKYFLSKQLTHSFGFSFCFSNDASLSF